MEARSLKFIAAACAGNLLAGSGITCVERVCTDSRQAKAGDLFIALTGERFDGHDFLLEVIRKGVAAVVVQRDRIPTGIKDCAIISVEDTRRALGHLAAKYRADFTLPIVAVGGSNGKTTTKELIASVLRQKIETVWSEASFNNDIGVPMTLLKLGKMHRAAVMEVGTNHRFRRSKDEGHRLTTQTLANAFDPGGPRCLQQQNVSTFHKALHR